MPGCSELGATPAHTLVSLQSCRVRYAVDTAIDRTLRYTVIFALQSINKNKVCTVPVSLASHLHLLQSWSTSTTKTSNI